MKKLLIVLAVLCGACFAATVAALVGLGIASETGLIPSTMALRGSDMPERDLTWLRENGVILEGEEVLWFYSAGLFSIAEDGNLFTPSAAISYEQAEGELVVFAADFAEVAEVEVAWSESFLEDTTITIGTDDDRWFDLWVSAEEGLDRAFHADLVERWQAAR